MKILLADDHAMFCNRARHSLKELDEVATTIELGTAAEVLLQLRPQYAHKQLLSTIEKQRLLGYQVACLLCGEQTVAVAGFSFGQKLSWGKHIYIDDFVTDENHRARGYGSFLLRWLIAHARELGCDKVRLDSGVQRFAAHRFYMREGFDILSHHFALTGLLRD